LPHPSNGAQRARRASTALLVALLVALGALLSGPAPAARASEPLKAVIIVGPTGSLTSQNLSNGEKMAQAAEAQGMQVRRIFHPRATWERVLAAVQGANLVVYMGHGNGWPSPYGPFQERTKNGFGLNPYEGSKASEHRYFGADRIRSSIKLADNAVVILVHLCYSSGNGEPGMSIPREDVARQRVDNYAAAFLAVGARAVFSSSYYQRFNLIGALHTTNRTMDELFMVPNSGRPNGFIGWRNKRFTSERMPGFRNHLDPHSSHGFVRALSGDLTMTAAEWRGGAASSSLKTTTSPSVPQNLKGEALGYRRIALSWDPSTGGTGQIRYRIFRDGVRIATVTGTSHVDRPSVAGTYRYKVRAVDEKKNRSAFSSTIKARAIRGPL
jgi:hypothetical protein